MRGINLLKGWINSGYGFPVENAGENSYKKSDKEIGINSCVKFYWSDSPLSLSCEKKYFHECIVQVKNQDTFTLVQILQGEKKAFGSWKRVDNIDYKYCENSLTTTSTDKTQGELSK